MITYKFKIQNKIDIQDYINQFNNVVRFSYNRFKDNSKSSLSDVEKMVKSTMNNIDCLDASLIKVAVNKARSIKKDNVIFGGKYNFKRLITKLISKDEWLDLRNFNLSLRGSSSDSKGNRKAELNIIDDNSILIKLSRENHFNVQLPRLNKHQKKLLSKLQILCEDNQGCFTVELNNDFVYIIFNETLVKDSVQRNIIQDRILSFDLNPNYIGLSITDWKNQDNKNIIYKEIVDLKSLNEKSRNKVKHEIFEISKHIINLSKHYNVSLISFEKLNIKSSNKNKGKSFNRLVNNIWLRNPLINNIKKRCNLESINYQEIVPQYSSFIGQIENPDDIDSVAASLELARRSYLFTKICKEKTLNHQNIIYPKFNIGSLDDRWKETLKNNLNDIKDWLGLYNWFKKSKTSYRFLFNPRDKRINSLRLFSVKSNVILHKFT